MASDKSRSQYAGLLIQDPRLRDPSCVWDAQSSYTETGPRPGVPVPNGVSGKSQMVLQATGEQEAGSTLVIYTQKAGMPGPGGAGILWNKAEDLYRGWDVPSVIAGWEAVEWTDGSGFHSVREVDAPHAVTLSDGTVLVTAQVRRVIAATTHYRIHVYRRNATTGAWTSTFVRDELSSPTFGWWPCLLTLPSGRVQLYHLDPRGSDACQVRMLYSDDGGVSWTVGADQVLTSPMDTQSTSGSGHAGGDPWRMRAAYKDGQVLLLVSYRLHDTSLDTSESYYQYASSDLGCSFDVVGSPWDGTALSDEGGAYHEILVLGGKFQMVFLGVNRSDRPVIRSVSNAYERLGSLTPTSTGILGTWGTLNTGAADYYDDGDLAAWVDEDGTAYVMGRQTTASNEIVLARSLDDGETWEMVGTSDFSTGFTDPVGKVFDFGDSATYPKNLCATIQGGRSLLLHNWAASPGDEGNSLGCAYLGGWSTVTMPATETWREDVSQASWLGTWLPLDKPDDVAWSLTGAGTATLTAGALNLQTSATSASYSRNPSGTIAEGLLVRMSLQAVSGGSLTLDRIGARLRVADGTNDYDVSIRVDLSGSDLVYRVYDNNAGAQVGDDTTVADTDSVDILVGLAAETVQVWHRARSLDTDRYFEEGPSSGSLTSDTATPEADHLIQWGMLTSSTGESNWYEVHYVSDSYAGFDQMDLSTGENNPDDLFPRTISDDYTYVDAGLRVRAVDGPGLAAETWTITARADYELDRVFPSVSSSPRVKWRSTSTAAQSIALVLDSAIAETAESALGNSAVGLYLGGINWRTGTWKGYDVDTTSWVSIASLDAATGLTGLAFTRKGNAIIPAVAGSGSQPYLHFNECAGWTFIFDDGTTRRVLSNTEGRWDRTSATCKRPTVILEGVEDDPTSGTVGVLVPTTYACVVYTSATYAGYQLVIDSQSTVDGYHEIGVLLPGPLVLFGSDYAWGRSVETEPGAELTEARDRTTRSTVPAPPRRTVEFSWVDGVDLTAVESGSPDYVLPSSTSGIAPAASVGDIPYLMDGLIGLLDGPHRPVVYIPRLTKGTPDTIHLNRRAQLLYGRTTGSVSVETVLGDAQVDELVRVGSIAVREDV